MIPRLRPLVWVAALALALAACGSGEVDDWSRPRAAPSAVGELRAGFLPATPPAPESTISPSPGSWDGISPAAGYRVVLLTYGDDDATRTVVDAVRDWAEAEGVSLRAMRPKDAHDFVPSMLEAIGMHPDLIVAAGNDLVDPLAAVTASHLAQQFLVVGAELAEPTYNVTSADWTGASFRGEGLGMSSSYDASTFTPERAGRAVRAGVAAVLSGSSGLVVWVD